MKKHSEVSSCLYRPCWLGSVCLRLDPRELRVDKVVWCAIPPDESCRLKWLSGKGFNTVPFSKGIGGLLNINDVTMSTRRPPAVFCIG